MKQPNCPTCLKRGVVTPKHKGLSYCAKCHRQRQRAAYRRERGLPGPGREVPRRAKLRPGLRQCLICLRPMVLSEFYANKGHSEGLSSYCKTCDKARNKDYRTQNSKKIAARHKAYHKANSKRINTTRKRWLLRKVLDANERD